MTGDLVAFLRARVTEDEQTAQAAAGSGDEAWTASRSEGGYLHDDGPRINVGDASHWVKTVSGGVWLCDDPADDCEAQRAIWMKQAAHIARHDPARVLAEVDAKRHILAEHAADGRDCRVCCDAGLDEDFGEHGGYLSRSALPAPCPTLRLLALPYRDHPDYREEEWRP